MKTIGDLLARDLNINIEEIIKVDQTDEQTVYREITEYVATERIKDQYRELFKAIAEAPTEPHENVGVWISGFFGSGKSSFAKNLGYVMANHVVLGHKASGLFKSQLQDKRSSEFIDLINVKLPAEVIMFDIQKGSEIRRGDEKMAEVIYRALLNHLGYATDYDIAELEIELEGEGKLKDFIDLCPVINDGLQWEKARKGARKINRASAILQRMDPKVFPQADSWAKSLREKHFTITVETVVERAFQLAARRRPGRALFFIIDEVGQYVARSADKIEDLRAIVEHFGKVSKNYLKIKKAVAPIWIIITSQEKLDEVVAAIDSKRVNIAKLQDRFHYKIDLSPADIREVATRRVLAKTDKAEPVLKALFKKSQGQLNAACRLDRTARKSEVTERDFVQFYPYLPHFVELSIDIMSGIRLQPGAPKHLGGSNRTIIKQAHEMLVSERTALAARPIGALVTFDKIYELVEGNLSTEKQKDISDISDRFRHDSDDEAWCARVAKTVCLLEFVRDLPRTETNIAACLVDEVDRPAPIVEVQSALQLLYSAQFVRNTEDGWKLQTAQEKNWETERRSHLEPKPKDRNEILREALRDIFSEPKLKTYRFRDMRNFRVGISVDGIRVGEEGQIPLLISTAEAAETFPPRLVEVRDESRQEVNKNSIYWVFALTSEIDDLVANLYASRQMVIKYDQMRAQNRITNEEAACLQSEKNEVIRLQNRLQEKLIEALQEGAGLFRGVSKDGSSLGKTINDIFKGLFDFAVPDLYPKLEMGARRLDGSEAEEILKAANLSALSQVFYAGDQGLNLVIKQGTKYVPNTSAEIAREIQDYIKREHSYGNKVTGKKLDEHFQGIGYGWDRDVLRLVLAVLLRAGALEVTYEGRRFRSPQEPQSRVPFINNTAFKSASFSPREAIDLKTLTVAVLHFEELTGEDVDVEEGAIAAAFKKLAETELDLLLPVVATAKVNQLPLMDVLQDYRQTLTGISTAASDDCVRILAGEGKSFQEARERVRKIREAIDDSGIAIIQQARNAAQRMWPALAAKGHNGDLQQKADELLSILSSDSFYEQMHRIERISNDISEIYHSIYAELHEKRRAAFTAAIEELKGNYELSLIPKSLHDIMLSSLSARACENQKQDGIAFHCDACSATLGEMESDLAALEGLKAQVLVRVQELAMPPEEKGSRVERIKISGFFTRVLDSDDAVEEILEQVRQHLHKLIAEGVRIIVE